jgi:hypothetical protein
MGNADAGSVMMLSRDKGESRVRQMEAAEKSG